MSPLALFEGDVEENKFLSTGLAVCRATVVHVLELELALELVPASGVFVWAACMIIICRLICGYAVRQVTRKIV